MPSSTSPGDTVDLITQGGLVITGSAVIGTAASETTEIGEACSEA